MIIKNTYLDIAENDLEYLEAVLKTGNTFYNQLAVQCQQIAEKFLKGYLERLLLEEDVSDLLRKNNMRKIAAKLNDINPELNLDIIGLSYLTDFYFDARYPGDDFYTVSKEEFEKCLRFLYKGIIINHNKKPSQPTLKRRFFQGKGGVFSWPGFGKEWC